MDLTADPRGLSLGQCATLLIRDRDASYGAAFRSRLKAMDITEVLSAPRSPWQNALC
jgi:hypothetical protein